MHRRSETSTFDPRSGAAAQYFGVQVSDPNHADVWGVVQSASCYTGGRSKIAGRGR
jgi:hypothetical protein